MPAPISTPTNSIRDLPPTPPHQIMVINSKTQDSVLKGNIHSTPAETQGIPLKRGIKTVKARSRESWPGTLFSEHDAATALTGSKQLWLPAQGLHTTEPVNIQAWMGQGAPGERFPEASQ